MHAQLRVSLCANGRLNWDSCDLPFGDAEELLKPLAEPGYEDFFGGRNVERVREAREVFHTLL